MGLKELLFAKEVGIGIKVYASVIKPCTQVRVFWNFSLLFWTLPCPSLFWPEHTTQRIITILKFMLVFVQALLDDATEALNSLCANYLSIAKVLRIEKCMLWQEMYKVSSLSFGHCFLLSESQRESGLTTIGSISEPSNCSPPPFLPQFCHHLLLLLGHPCNGQTKRDAIGGSGGGGNGEKRLFCLRPWVWRYLWGGKDLMRIWQHA